MVVQGTISKRMQLDGVQVLYADYAPGVVFRRHAHDSSSVSLILSGALEESSTHGIVRAGVGHVAVKPAGAWHANEYGPRCVRSLVLQFTNDLPTLLQGGAPTYRWEVAGRLTRAMFSLACEFAGPAPKSTGASLALADAWAALANAAPHRASAQPRWLADVEQFILENLTAGLTAASIAALAGVHPVHLARVFHQHRGCGVSEFVQAARVAAAARLFRETTLGAAEIALRVGCCDQAHLCRLFKARVGVTSRAYRRLCPALHCIG